MVELVIELLGVTKRYADGSLAVDSLTLEVPSGTVSVLVGPSGCGKTTTLRMINRMIEPTSGTVLIDGRDVTKGPPHALRRSIGYVIQQGGLFPHRTVLDNVTTVPRLLGWSKARARTRAMEMLELVGLDVALAKRYPAQLSGGQQQRVGVARALATDPPVLLMDEPFGAVDPVVRGQLQLEFRRLQQRLGITVVFVTHDIHEALSLGDRIAVLGPSAFVHQYAPPAELLASPADEFVVSFVGADRHIALLGLTPASKVAQRPLTDLLPSVPVDSVPAVDCSEGSPATARTLLDAALGHETGYALCTDGEDPTGVVHLADLTAVARDAA